MTQDERQRKILSCVSEFESLPKGVVKYLLKNCMNDRVARREMRALIEQGKLYSPTSNIIQTNQSSKLDPALIRAIRVMQAFDERSPGVLPETCRRGPDPGDIHFERGNGNTYFVLYVRDANSDNRNIRELDSICKEGNVLQPRFIIIVPEFKILPTLAVPSCPAVLATVSNMETVTSVPEVRFKKFNKKGGD